MSHSKSPWKPNTHNIETSNNIQYEPKHDGASTHELKANAHLISASPEMLETLELIEELAKTSFGHLTQKEVRDALAQVTNTIAKAKGI